MHKLKKIYIEITNHCNLSCSFCKKNDRPKQFISLDNFKLIINKIKPHTSYIYLHVLGEPLLHRDIGEMLDICHQNDIKASITTNATLIKSQAQNLVNKPALRQINYSLHSIFEGDSSYKDIILDIANLISSTKASVYHCLRLWNYGSLDEDKNSILFKELSNALNIPIRISQEITSGHGVKILENVFVEQQERFVWPSLDGDDIFAKGKCGGLKHDVGILVDGTVTPCCLDGNGDIPLGNIYGQSLEDILSCKRALDIRQGFAQGDVLEKLCKTCGFAQRNFG